MSDNSARNHQYEYKENSNIVLQADTRLIEKARGENSGQVMSLAGKLGKVRMGDCAGKRKIVNFGESKAKWMKHGQSKYNLLNSKLKKQKLLSEDSHDEVTAVYQPKTAETQRTYEVLLSFIIECIEYQPRTILYATADEILAVLKDESLKDHDKKKQMDLLLDGTLSEENFTLLVSLGKKITDFGNDGGSAVDKTYEDTYGVSVEFADESDEDQDIDEVRDIEDNDDENSTYCPIKIQNLPIVNNQTNFENTICLLDIDAYWLEKNLNKLYNNTIQSQEHAQQVLEILKNAAIDLNCENQLVLLLGYDCFNFIKLLIQNRNVIYYCTILASSQCAEERQKIRNEMKKNPKLAEILCQLDSGEVPNEMKKSCATIKQQDEEAGRSNGQTQGMRKVIDLNNLVFEKGSHMMANKTCNLPEGSTRKAHNGYVEICVSASTPKPFDSDEQLKPIDQLPLYVQAAFKCYFSLNRIQSRLCDQALGSDENLLVCAPTGAGKTNIALLCLMREIGKYVNSDNSIQSDAFKIIYIAPMRSLVQEMVDTFRKRLASYNLTVSELTGDHQLTRQQIDATQIIVCTPEKWDIITRKGADKTFISLVKLVIIDEIHLLHDNRGPVLEALVARTIRNIETTRENVRLVGLSATLPNYQDVAHFLRVNVTTGLYYFDNSFRPVALKQQFIGVSKTKAVKRCQLINEIVYKKTIQNAGRHQVLIFVHSRKETVKTAKMIRDMCIDKSTLGRFLDGKQTTMEILRSEAEKVNDENLKDLLPYGFAVHHAGMTKVSRCLVEDLFSDRHVQVLVSTATLAWGVNLPAHTVIIKGIQVYNTEKGHWTELQALDILQMIGRAGRPQYDVEGEGIVITNDSELLYHLSVLNQQFPIESQMISKMPDLLNAEIVLGTIENIRDAVGWLGYTYLYIRMLRNPTLYGISYDVLKEDPLLELYRKDLIHSAALLLKKSGLIKYDRKSGNFQSTELGKIASHYYCTYQTMLNYNCHLTESCTEIDLLRVFSLSSEFKNIYVRDEEKIELQKLIQRVPYPIKENVEESSSKVSILLQTYIGKLKLEGFVIKSDMVYIAQSASRLMRAMFEIALFRGWAQVTEKCLLLCKKIDRKMSQIMYPYQQLSKMPKVGVLALMKKCISLNQLFDLEPQAIGELIRAPKLGKIMHKCLHQFPKVELKSFIQPINRTTLRVELTITPDFQWDEKTHGMSEGFWIFVQDYDNAKILHHEYFLLKSEYGADERRIKFFLPIYDPRPPQYYIRVVSDRWIGAESELPVVLHHLILPEKNQPPTDILDLQPLPIRALNNVQYENLYVEKFSHFNSIQTQVFNIVYGSEKNVFVGASTGSGKTLIAELSILRMITEKPDGRCVYIVTKEPLAEIIYNDWNEKFSKLNKNVVLLTGKNSTDSQLVAESQIIISTAEKWDMLSRRWQQRKCVKNIQLLIIDELHTIGGEEGPILEVVSSRARYISLQLEKPTRIICLSAPLANFTDIAQWLGVPQDAIFNFHPSVRPTRLRLHIQGLNIADNSSRLGAMTKPAYNAIIKHSPHKPVVIFVPSRRLTRLIAIDILTFAATEAESSRFLHKEESEIKQLTAQINDKFLQETLSQGVGYLHEGLFVDDRRLVEHLFEEGAIQVVIVTKNLCWSLSMKSYLVLIVDTQCYNGKTNTYEDYPLADLMQMIGCANKSLDENDAICVILCQSTKQNLLERFLNDPFPVESHLNYQLHNHFNAEISNKVIENKQDAVDYLTWTFFFQRLTKNPNYYGLQEVSHHHLNDYLSELVEETIEDLEKANLIATSNLIDVSPLNLGMIATYYYINFDTIELFSSLLSDKTKIAGLIEIISSATEYQNVPIRPREGSLLKRLAQRLLQTHQYLSMRMTDPHVKTQLLLRAHLSRIQLSSELQKDTEFILSKVIRLIHACVDVASSLGLMTPVIAALELSQMITQAMWSRESVLKQIPHFKADTITRCVDKKIETVFDIIEMDDEERNKLLQMTQNQMVDVARFCNHYPNIEITYEIENVDNIQSGSTVNVIIHLEREDQVEAVVAPFFCEKREENWFIIIGNPEVNSLLSIKKITLQQKATVKLNFTAPMPGQHSYTLYFISDAYLGSDQEYKFTLNCNTDLE